MMEDKVAEKLKIIELDINSITPYTGNAKLHPKNQIEQIKKSILEFNMIDPIAVYGKDNTIVEGHGRYLACQELGYEKMPCIRLDHLTDEQRKAYTLAHNKLTMNSDFDMNILADELDDITNINMSDFGFDLGLDDDTFIEEIEDDKYTKKVDVPQYEITGAEPSIDELVKKEKASELIKEIENSNVTKEQKEFLKMAAYRHLAFNYSNIAEYYAHQDKEMQELMEKSALVILDYDDAIRNGYVELSNKLDEIEESDVEYND